MAVSARSNSVTHTFLPRIRRITFSASLASFQNSGSWDSFSSSRMSMRFCSMARYPLSALVALSGGLDLIGIQHVGPNLGGASSATTAALATSTMKPLRKRISNRSLQGSSSRVPLFPLPTARHAASMHIFSCNSAQVPCSTMWPSICVLKPQCCRHFPGPPAFQPNVVQSIGFGEAFLDQRTPPPTRSPQGHLRSSLVAPVHAVYAAPEQADRSARAHQCRIFDETSFFTSTELNLRSTALIGLAICKPSGTPVEPTYPMP